MSYRTLSDAIGHYRTLSDAIGHFQRVDERVHTGSTLGHSRREHSRSYRTGTLGAIGAIGAIGHSRTALGQLSEFTLGAIGPGLRERPRLADLRPAAAAAIAALVERDARSRRTLIISMGRAASDHRIDGGGGSAGVPEVARGARVVELGLRNVRFETAHLLSQRL